MNRFLKWIPGLLALVLLPLLFTGKPATAWQAKVDAWVLDHTSNGQTAEFILFLNQQANLGQAQRLSQRAEKGAYVLDQLEQTAQNTQKPVLQALEQWSAQNPGQVDYRSYWIANMIWVRGDARLVQALALRPEVAHIYANPSVKLDEPAPETARPNQGSDPDTVEWNIAKVGAPTVWAAGYTGQGAVIAGQDTGYQWDHPALKNQYRGWNGSSADHNYNWHDAIHSGGGSCGANSQAPCDDSYHGTHTMGTMVGDDGKGNQVGMAPGARWIGCRNMDQGTGTPSTYAECFQWFIAPTDLNGNNPRPDLAPDVINNSWSCPPSEGCTDPQVLKTVVDNVRAAGILTVQSAGNSGPSCSTIDTPAAIYDSAFTVGNTTSSDAIASSSSRGPITVDGSNRLKPDIAAPGSGIRSTIPTNGYSVLSGTSMAAPHVVGLAALLISAKPSLAGNPDLLEALIEQNAVHLTSSETCGGVPGQQVPNNTFGWGRIDAAKTVLEVISPTLSIRKTASTLSIQPGEILTYTIQVKNTSPVITHHVQITDVLPANTVFITATLPFTRTENAVAWSFPSLGATQSLYVNLVVQANSQSTKPIVNQFYSTKSTEVPLATGVPVTVTLRTTGPEPRKYYFPWIVIIP